MENVFNQSIWGDEGFSAILSMRPLPEVIKIIANDTSPPLWNIWEWVAFNTLGTDEIYIRLLSLIFFLGTVLFTFKFGKLLWGKRTGTLAALLTALNPFFFIYAFEGRMYSIMALGVAGSMYYFAKVFLDEGSPRDRMMYVFWSLWALYSHHFAIFAMMFQGLWFLYEYAFNRRKTAKKIFKSFLAIGIGYLPWMIPLYNQTKKVGGGFWLSTPDTNDLFVLIFDYLAEGIKMDSLKFPILEIPLYEIALILVLIILITRNWFRSYKKTIFIMLWFLFPILATWLVSQYFTSVFFNRYLLYTIPGAMLLLATNRRGFASMIMIGVTLLFFGIIDYQYFTNPAKLNFKAMAKYVEETRKEGDFFINPDAGSHHLWESKYYGFNAPIYVPDGNELPFFVGTALMMEDDIIQTLPDIGRVGVITSGSTDDIQLPEEFFESDRNEIGNLKFVWFEREDVEIN